MTIELTGQGIVLKRIENLIRNVSPNSKALKAALGKAGTVIASLAKMNIQRLGIIDQGHLINSIKYQFYNDGPTSVGIKVGSFGVVYAAMNEFGGTVTPAMKRAMFASMKARGKMQPGAASKARANSKGVIVGNRWRARPFLTPAYQQSIQYVVNTVAEAIASDKADG